MDRHSEVLIQGTNVPGGQITVTVPVDHTFSTDFARNTYPYDGAQYIWMKSWNVGESNTKSRSSSSSSGGGGCLTLVGLVFLIIVGGVSGGGDDKPTPTETPQPPINTCTWQERSDSISFDCEVVDSGKNVTITNLSNGVVEVFENQYSNNEYVHTENGQYWIRGGSDRKSFFANGTAIHF